MARKSVVLIPRENIGDAVKRLEELLGVAPGKRRGPNDLPLLDEVENQRRRDEEAREARENQILSDMKDEARNAKEEMRSEVLDYESNLVSRVDELQASVDGLNRRVTDLIDSFQDLLGLFDGHRAKTDQAIEEIVAFVNDEPDPADTDMEPDDAQP